MKIIGAGFGRTGTTSLQAALVQLGFDPCYHMSEVFNHAGHDKIWAAAYDGKPTDWHAFLGNYQAGLDYPICNFYKELMEVYPDAKVLLSVRDSDRWYESTLTTIYKLNHTPKWLWALVPPVGRVNRLASDYVWGRLYGGRFEDKDFAIGVYEQHIADVKATVPVEKLLVFNVKEGWEPLCRFLDCPVPDAPFPHLNDRQQIATAVKVMNGVGRYGVFVLIAILALILLIIFR